MNFHKKAIEIIESNRISSTEVADALGKKGVLSGYQPLNENHFLVGQISYIFAHDESNWPIHFQIKDLSENKVIFIDSFNCNEKALFGDLVAKYIMLYKKSKGIIANGFLRDIPDLKKYNYPIWCKGHTPLGCFNKDVKPTKEVLGQTKINKNKLHNSLIICDDSGCTIIENHLINAKLIEKLKMIELQEDIWSFCINTLKWSTYETICLKKYLDDSSVLPDKLKQKVKAINLIS